MELPRYNHTLWIWSFHRNTFSYDKNNTSRTQSQSCLSYVEAQCILCKDNQYKMNFLGFLLTKCPEMNGKCEQDINFVPTLMI